MRQRGGGGGEVTFLRVNDHAGGRVDFTGLLIRDLNGLRQHVGHMQRFVQVFVNLVGGLHSVIQRHFTVHSGGVEEVGDCVGAVRRKIVTVRYGQFVVSHCCCLSL